MAKLDIEFSNDQIDKLLKTDSEELCKKMLSESAEIVKRAMQENIRRVITNKGDSDLVKSVKKHAPKRMRTGGFVSVVNPTGESDHYYYGNDRKTRKYKVSNALKAIWLNYGRKGQPARPFLTKTKNDAEPEVIKKMQEVYERECKL